MPTFSYVTPTDGGTGTGGTVTNNNVWHSWVISGTVTTSSSSNIIWNTWVDGTNTATTTSATVTSNNNVWTYWVSADGSYVANGPQGHAYQETDEQREAREAQQREWQKDEAKRKKDQEEANQRAIDLFKKVVGKEKFKRFQERGYHEVAGKSGTRYRLRPSKRIMLMRGDIGDEVEADLCIHHTYNSGLPPMDTLIHQMLCIMAEEETLIKTANRHQHYAAAA